MTEANNNGNGHGINTITLIDCRIAGPADYIPAHPKQNAQPGDRDIQAQADFTVYQNIRDKKMTFEITAWGKMADVIARGGATGKQVHLICSMHSYRGKVWFPVPDGAPRQFVTRADGQPLMIEKVGLTLEDISFGVDSAKTIQEEINRGFRPLGWNDPSNPGYQDWRNRCAQNNAIQYQPGMEWFGYARVKTYGQPAQQNQGYQQNNGFQQPQYNQQYNQQNQQHGQAQQYNQQHNTGFQGVQNQQHPNTQTNYGQNNGGNPQYVNGQYVGQQMPQQPVPPQNQQYQQYQQPNQNQGVVM